VVDPRTGGSSSTSPPGSCRIRHALLGPAHAVGQQRPRQQPHADRSRTGRSGRPVTVTDRTTCTYRRRSARDRRRRGPPRARLPRTAQHAADARAAGSPMPRRRPHGLHRRRPAPPWPRASSARACSSSTSSTNARCARPPRRRDAPGRQALADGRIYVADMASNGVWLIDARSWRVLRLQPTGAGARLYPAATAGCSTSPTAARARYRPVIPDTRPIAKWRLPGGGSPDMGGVSADGRAVARGRFNAELYAIRPAPAGSSTASASVAVRTVQRYGCSPALLDRPPESSVGDPALSRRRRGPGASSPIRPASGRGPPPRTRSAPTRPGARPSGSGRRRSAQTGGRRPGCRAHRGPAAGQRGAEGRLGAQVPQADRGLRAAGREEAAVPLTASCSTRPAWRQRAGMGLNVLADTAVPSPCSCRL
jgi:hypothetical protein